MSCAKPSFETNTRRGVKPVFQQEILLTRLSVAQRVFKNIVWSLCFPSIIPGSFRSLLPPHAQFIGFGKRSCSSLVAACVSVLMNSRPILARDTRWNSERNNFQLAKMPILLPGISAGARDYLADSVPLCSLCPHLHIRGCLDFFTLLAFRVFESLWAPLGSPFLLKWERQWRGLLLTSASRASDFPVWFEAIYTEWIWSWEIPGLWVKWILWSRKRYVFRQGFHIRSTFRIT